MISKETIKRYLISSLTTFIAGFAIAVLPHIESLSPETLSTGAISGILFAGVRAGIKAVLELFVTGDN